MKPNDQGSESDHWSKNHAANGWVPDQWSPFQVSLIERQTNPLYAHKL